MIRVDSSAIVLQSPEHGEFRISRDELIAIGEIALHADVLTVDYLLAICSRRFGVVLLPMEDVGEGQLRVLGEFAGAPIALGLANRITPDSRISWPDGLSGLKLLDQASLEAGMIRPSDFLQVGDHLS